MLLLAYFSNIIDPSKDAIGYGNNFIKKKQLKIKLECTTADNLPYADGSMDCIIIGFCMFWCERKYLFRSIAEIDRVLKIGGILLIEDFDTTVPYIRNNIHNPYISTYKINYTGIFLSNPQYFMIEKHSYSHKDKSFHKDIQERVSTCI